MNKEHFLSLTRGKFIISSYASLTHVASEPLCFLRLSGCLHNSRHVTVHGLSSFLLRSPLFPSVIASYILPALTQYCFNHRNGQVLQLKQTDAMKAQKDIEIHPFFICYSFNPANKHWWPVCGPMWKTKIPQIWILLSGSSQSPIIVLETFLTSLTLKMLTFL